MLITTCTHCLARFRVTPQQLNLKQGQVRCGHCQQVFSGFEALERFPDDDTGSRILAARAAAAAPIPASTPAPIPPPIPAPDLADRPAPFDSIPLDQLPEIRDDKVGRGDGVAIADAIPTVDAQPVTDEPTAAEPPPAPARHEAEAPYARRASTLNLLAAEYPPPEPAPRLPRAWILGCALMGLLIALQALYAMRAQVAQAYPVTRPWLESTCAVLGCRVPWVNDPLMLKLEDSELLEVPGRPGEIALGARIRNLAASAQEFPHLELTLTDLTGQAAARRVLRPTDYLGRPPVQGDVMAAGSELAIQLRLETPRIKPTGYELLLFYPQAAP
jgi:predicted Zn finger-like uncharacterized protein